MQIRNDIKNMLIQEMISIGHQEGFWISKPPMRYIAIPAMAAGRTKQHAVPDLLGHIFKMNVIMITNIIDTIKLL